MSLIKSHKFLSFSFAYTLFIIYGSLVPLNYRYLPFDDALLYFQQIRYLDLGAASRADWISNIVLYIPLTFSLASAFVNRLKPFQIFISFILLLTFSLSLAVTIEFYQLFYPPRTVSQNDLIAEAIGSVIGLILWFGYGGRLQKLYAHILQGGKQALLASAVLYLFAYLAISFFPYDFVTSIQELTNKLHYGSDAFFISSSCGGLVFCNTKLVVEIFTVIPLGLFLAVLLERHPRRRSAVMLIGFIIGIIIEIIQLFLISGIAQGVSIFTRVAGLGLGEFVYTKISTFKKPSITVNFKKYLSLAFVPYIFLLAPLNGWKLFPPSFSSAVTEKIHAIHWLPFYYHYFTSEAVALTSLLSVFAMYFPIGLGVWLWYLPKNNSSYKYIAGLFALGLCFVMEAGKLFFLGKHPDPTNLIISFASAIITYAVAELMYQWFRQSEIKQPMQHNEALLDSSANPRSISSTDKQAGNSFAKGLSSILVALLLWKLIDYPGSSAGLAAALLLYGILLQKYSYTWLVVIPALLPVSDFSPWTGRLFFTEFDYFVVLSFAISLWYGRWNSPLKILKPLALLFLTIYIACYFISLLIGLLPLQTMDANAFANYYSHYNSLRVAKGLIWASLFLLLLAYKQHSLKKIKRYFTYGILTGLIATVLFSFWERIVFTGLFDFSSDFRISSTFYSMHIGGASLDAYLLLSMPFICLLFIQLKNSIVRTLFIPLLFSASLYTLLVTYSRGTYIAFILATIILLAGLTIFFRSQIAQHWKKVLWLPLFLILTAIVTVPILKGSFIQHRFSQASQEVGTRSNHWRNAINMMDTGFISALFGMGLGSFPRTYLWNSLADQAPATFLLQHDNKDNYLQLGSGRPLYIEQIIDIAAYSNYKLKLDYRTDSVDSRLNISICEKAIQHSFYCQGVDLIASEKQTHWQHYEHTINTQSIGDSFRPVKLVLHNSQPNTSIDIKNIFLNSVYRKNVLKNGNFSKGMDHWFFTSDDHIPWRTENLWVQTLFDQGWLGLISFNLLLLYFFANLYLQSRKQDYFSLITLTSLSGFLVLSVIDSTLNQPVISLLFFLTLYISLLRTDSKVTRNKYPTHIMNY